MRIPKILVSCLVVVAASAPLFAHAADTKKPNIIFILTDDLGYGDVGTFFQNLRKKANNRSQPWTATPKLDQMAAEGCRLTDHYCPAAVCAPSRASLLLGVHQGHANVRDSQFDKALENNHTLATVLKAAGYKTVAIGKWGLQGKGDSAETWPAYPTKRGFDSYFGYVRHGDGHEHYPKEGLYKGAKEIWDNEKEISSQLDKCYTADLFASRAKQFIIDQRATNGAQPFFMYLAFDTPHAVDELPTQEYPKGAGLKGGLRWIGEPGHMINTASGTVDSWYHPDYAHATYDDDRDPKTPEVAWSDVDKRYATAIRRVDDCVGDLLQLLKDLKIDKNTLVVFSSDNGPSIESYLKQPLTANFFHSFGPFDGIKRDLWEGGLRVPTLAWWPGNVRSGTTVSLPSQSHDWMATFADAAGIPAPARCDGVSLLPSMTRRGDQLTPTVYSEYFSEGKTPDYPEFARTRAGRKRGQMQTIRLGKFQGVRYNVQSHKDNFEIYDVTKDPGQRTNLASHAEYSVLQKEMKDAVLQLRRADPTAPRPYDKELIPDVFIPRSERGIRWSSYANETTWLPSFKGSKELAHGTAATPDVAVLRRIKDVGIVFSGLLNVPADGEYTIYLTADTKALLRIHQATVIDGDFGCESGVEKSGKILLHAGFHPFQLYYARRAEGTPSLNLEWSGPGMEKRTIPAPAFYREVKKK